MNKCNLVRWDCILVMVVLALFWGGISAVSFHFVSEWLK